MVRRRVGVRRAVYVGAGIRVGHGGVIHMCNAASATVLGSNHAYWRTTRRTIATKLVRLVGAVLCRLVGSGHVGCWC